MVQVKHMAEDLAYMKQSKNFSKILMLVLGCRVVGGMG